MSSLEKKPSVIEPSEAVEEGVIARVVARVGDEALTGGVEAVVGREGGGVAGEKGGTGGAEGAVAAGRAGDPDEVAAGIGNEEEVLRRGAEVEGDEVLAGAGGSAGSDGRFEVVEMGEIKRDGTGGMVSFVEKWEFEIFCGGGGYEEEKRE
ncbi:hypothetical protein CUMW_101650 [Citrus unshiu]|nr:hypothetical protein CUMW_101650 [Citrus unshiu]